MFNAEVAAMVGHCKPGRDQPFYLGANSSQFQPIFEH
jgi:hypothetical protein